MARFQLALDNISSEEGIRLINGMSRKPDIIEAGTLLLLREGTEAIRKLRNAFPQAVLLADPKIMDASKAMSEACLDAGANVVTIMAAVDSDTLQEAAETARKRGGKLCIDLLHADRMPDLEGLDDVIDSIVLHTPIQAGKPDFETLHRLRAHLDPSWTISLAGGINTENAAEAAALKPDIVILGRSILEAKDPGLALETIAEVFE